LKGLPAYAGAGAEDLESIVREWHRQALPVITTKPFAATWRDFVSAWGLVRYPAGCTLAGITTSGPGALQEHDALRRLEIVAAELQRRAGDRPFPLSCRIAAKLAGISTVQANRLINRQLAAGTLFRTRAGQQGSSPGKLAAEYHYAAALATGAAA
jgi:hypothetical protein